MSLVRDARYHPRLRIHASADVIGSEVVLARTVEDLSLGGCKFSGPAWEPQGTAVEMVISFADRPENVPIKGVVVRASQNDMAVRFEDVTEEQFGSLQTQLRSIESQTN